MAIYTGYTQETRPPTEPMTIKGIGEVITWLTVNHSFMLNPMIYKQNQKKLRNRFETCILVQKQQAQHLLPLRNDHHQLWKQSRLGVCISSECMSSMHGRQLRLVCDSLQSCWCWADRNSTLSAVHVPKSSIAWSNAKHDTCVWRDCHCISLVIQDRYIMQSDSCNAGDVISLSLQQPTDHRKQARGLHP